jgi:hypothetical protein
MNDSVYCNRCGCAYSRIRKVGDRCGDLSYAGGAADAEPCSGICVSMDTGRRAFVLMRYARKQRDGQGA